MDEDGGRVVEIGMDVVAVLRRLHALREGGAGLAQVVPDWVTGILGRIENRAQLDELLAGLPNALPVAERTERFLTFSDPVSSSPDELTAWAREHVAALVGVADQFDLPTAGQALAMLSDAPVQVREADEWPEDCLQLCCGGAEVPAVMPAGSVLTARQLAQVEFLNLELGRVLRQPPDEWRGIAWAFFSATEDVGGIGQWMLAPAASWPLDLEPFYRIWESGATLWIGPDGLEVVRAFREPRVSRYSLEPPPPPPNYSPEDLVWLERNPDYGRGVLDEVLAILQAEHGDLELEGRPMSSLPPAFFQSTSWRSLDLVECGDIEGLEQLATIENLEVISLPYCKLKTVPDVWPPHLTALVLAGNDLTAWPSGLGQSLVTLHLDSNRLADVPESVGELTALRRLNLDLNDLRTIPSSIGRLTNLEWLSLSFNRELQRLPIEVLDLPDGCEVSFVATALPEAMRQAETIQDLRSAWDDGN